MTACRMLPLAVPAMAKLVCEGERASGHETEHKHIERERGED